MPKVAFLADGKHIVGGGRNKVVRCWRVEDGKEVGPRMNADSEIFCIAASGDGRWVVCGTESGRVVVWSASSREQVAEFRHKEAVYAVDISTDGTRIASGSKDCAACVWSMATARRHLLYPLKHDQWVDEVKFSPNGRLLATCTEAVRIYDDRRPLVEFAEIGQGSVLAWACDNTRLFALSSNDTHVHCLDVSSGSTLNKWPVQFIPKSPTLCIALSKNDKFIVAVAGTAVSYWDVETCQQIGSTIEQTVWSIAISSTFGMATKDRTKTVLDNLCDILPSVYRDSILRERESHCKCVMKAGSEEPDSATPALDEQIKSLEKTIEDLNNQLATTRDAANQDKHNLDATIKSLRTQNEKSESKITHLGSIIEELRDELATSQHAVDRQQGEIRSSRADLAAQKTNFGDTIKELRDELATSQRMVDEKNETIGSLDTDLKAQEINSANLEKINQELRNRANRNEYNLTTIIQCEALYGHERIYDAIESLLKTAMTLAEDSSENRLVANWLTDFTGRCMSRLQVIGDEASSAQKHEEAITAYSTALSLISSAPSILLEKWARSILLCRPVNEALNTATKFKFSRFHVYRAFYDVLEREDRVIEATECLQRMKNSLLEDDDPHGERAQWELDLRRRSVEKLEKSGDTAKNSKRHDEAMEYYSNALSLDPENINDVIVKSLKARKGWLGDELDKVNKAIERDRSSCLGYKRKHAVLRTMKRHGEAFEAFETMLSKIEGSSDPRVRELRGHYKDLTPTIREVIEKILQDIPRVLIDMKTGELYDRKLQAAAFEERAIFNELRSTMTTTTTDDKIHRARIRREGEDFYQYVMFSHRWQPDEPSFQTVVEKGSIDALPTSPTNIKLNKFCEVVRTHRYRWAWSDTCCINQTDKGVQQESVVAMFRWYSGAALTIVHLLGVFSYSQVFGDLLRSIWNTRGWTYQEYIASKVVQFYTEDWKPYLGLEIFNHKESPLILSEMERLTNVTSQELATLEPGLDRVREKLYLASKRKTTREEDVAYSLFGIFSTALSVIYGEGKQAVGRLLEHILTRSADVTLLAWTGISGSHHSYLPLDLSVYDQIVPPHVPQLVETAEMEHKVKALQSSIPDLPHAVEFYEQLCGLQPLSLSSGRLKLPVFAFPLTDLQLASQSHSSSKLHVYRATSSILKEVQIETAHNLSRMKRLLLVHPWISTLLDQDFSDDGPGIDLDTRALRLIVRLKQPFGALLLAQQGRMQYRRVATDSWIEVQVREETTVQELVNSIRADVDIQ